jgi:5,10-methylene-tetrahydrofolate dehydrogenase/methenyl tetrahydrofolate cyclohydrolase
MSAQIISVQIAKQIQEELKQKLPSKSKHNLIPGLATVLVGDPASKSMWDKGKACHELGIYSKGEWQFTE